MTDKTMPEWEDSLTIIRGPLGGAIITDESTPHESRTYILKEKHNRLLDECSDTHKRLVKEHHDELSANYSDSVAKILDIHQESITRCIERVEGFKFKEIGYGCGGVYNEAINRAVAAIKEELE